MVSQSSPPPLLVHPTSNLLAIKDQRIRAGLIDHAIDSTVWFWLFIIAAWTGLNLHSVIDARSFIVLLATQFPISFFSISSLLIFDFLLCVCCGQSMGQRINGIYKTNQTSLMHHYFLNAFKVWLHGLVSRCLGLPLLCVCTLLIMIFNPMIAPIPFRDFSLIEPEGAYLLMSFLLKIIGMALLLFAFFLPAGLGFICGSLPTWYDKRLGVLIIRKTQ